MVSNIYNSSIPIWKVGSRKDKSREWIEKENSFQLKKKKPKKSKKMELNETTLKELYQVRDTLNRILGQIENGSTVYTNNQSVSVPKQLVANSDIRYPKDLPYLKILRGSSGINDWQKNFLDNLIQNDYTSITAKQKEVLDGIIKVAKHGN